MKWVAMTLWVIALLAGCKRTVGPTRSYAAQIKTLESADPGADVDRATAAGDLRFVGVMGYGLIVPGVPDWPRIAAPGRVRRIPNTSDAIESDEHARLQRVAYHYAERYNQVLLTKIPALATSRPAPSASALMNTTMPSR